jgi:hypothetical protein
MAVDHQIYEWKKMWEYLIVLVVSKNPGAMISKRMVVGEVLRRRVVMDVVGVVEVAADPEYVEEEEFVGFKV